MAVKYASPVDYGRYGRYGESMAQGFQAGKGFHRPRYRFQGRVTADGSSGYRAEPGRYHLYVAWGCPWANRAAIVRKLKKLENVVSLSYVDDERDGRGWAFREKRGPDPVNGFTFLSEAYEAAEPGYQGHVSVPVLWDRQRRVIVSNNFPDITIDLGTQFEEWADTSVQLYPPELRAEIDELNAFLYDNVNDAPYRVAGATTEQEYDRLRKQAIAALGQLDQRLADRRYLLGGRLTEPDVRLWVTLARFDAGYNPMARISERPLTGFRDLWGYARDLYSRPEFSSTVDFSVFPALASGPGPSFRYNGIDRIGVRPRLADWFEPATGRAVRFA